MKILVENIKCGGCANTITTKLNAHFNTDSTEVNIEKGEILIALNDNKIQELKEVLLKLGYPEQGSVEGLQAATTKAKSFISCATGKLK
jgi:copper chaperone CopZ